MEGRIGESLEKKFVLASRPSLPNIQSCLQASPNTRLLDFLNEVQLSGEGLTESMQNTVLADCLYRRRFQFLNFLSCDMSEYIVWLASQRPLGNSCYQGSKAIPVFPSTIPFHYSIPVSTPCNADMLPLHKLFISFKVGINYKSLPAPDLICIICSLFYHDVFPLFVDRSAGYLHSCWFLASRS